MTLGTPLLFFLLFELGLRIVGFGGSHPLFIDTPDMPGYRQANPMLMQRYFPSPHVTPDVQIDPIHFAAEKPAGSYRIVVQGGSTAAGFPYGRWGGLAGMLGDRLEATFPDRKIEVISTALASVTSYTLLDVVDEVIASQPDAVLVYAGHNEYLGVLGVGSAIVPARFPSITRVKLWLRRIRIYQLVQRLAYGAQSLFSDGTTAADRVTMMARAAAGAGIPFGSERFEQGVRQLETNLEQILERYREAGVPVYLGTLVSNEKDLEPLSSKPPAGHCGPEWETAWEAYRAALRSGDEAVQRSTLSRLLAIDDGVAFVWFALGDLERRAGRTPEALDAYRKARDRDELRFRAPEAFNAVIRRLAKRHGATLVDVEEHLRAASPEGLVGNELLLEHVHPNAEGYFLLADAYYEALRRNRTIGDWANAPSREEAQRDMPITAVDRLLAAHWTRELLADYPFRETRREVTFPPPANEIEQLALRQHRGELGWLEAMEGLLQHYRGTSQHEEAIVVARIAAQAFPTVPAPSFSAGKLYLDAKQFARARQYLDRSLALQPDDVPTLAALVRTNLELGDAQRARAHFAHLAAVAPRHAAVQRLGALPALHPDASEAAARRPSTGAADSGSTRAPPPGPAAATAPR